MPPKQKVTREMIIDAAFEIARVGGIESVNARSIAARLRCSTQPVFYNFSTMEEICREIYRRADDYHTRYVMAASGEDEMLAIGAAYVRFAAEEKQLFRLLFQSNNFSKQRFDELLDDESTRPQIEILMRTFDLSLEQAKDAFATRFLLAHGMASMFANNSMEYNETDVLRLLKSRYSELADAESKRKEREGN